MTWSSLLHRPGLNVLPTGKFKLVNGKNIVDVIQILYHVSFEYSIWKINLINMQFSITIFWYYFLNLKSCMYICLSIEKFSVLIKINLIDLEWDYHLSSSFQAVSKTNNWINMPYRYSTDLIDFTFNNWNYNIKCACLLTIP